MCTALTGYLESQRSPVQSTPQLKLGNLNVPGLFFHKSWLEVCIFELLCWCKLLFCTGLNIVEVAHDIQQQVSGYVKRLGLVNSFDTWHGITYNFAICLI